MRAALPVGYASSLAVAARPMANGDDLELEYDEDEGRYFYESGAVVSVLLIRRAVEASLEAVRRRTVELQADLRAGRISLMAWNEEMRLIIKQTQLMAVEIAAGGREAMTQRDYGRAGNVIRRQYGYLERWTAQIAEGTYP